MLDTNTVSYIVKRKSTAARERLAGLSPDEVACISTITEGELLYGLSKIGLNEARLSALQWFLARLKVLSWDRHAAAAYGKLRARQEAAGRPLGPLDMQIAAHAVATGATLVSSDKAFLHVANLPGVEVWASDL